jgi:hypothetical protein
MKNTKSTSSWTFNWTYTDTSVTTRANLLIGYKLSLGGFSLIVSMVCLLEKNLMFSLVTGYKIMNYQRYCLGLCYLKCLKQVMFACWDYVCSAVHRNVALLWTFHLQELNMNTCVLLCAFTTVLKITLSQWQVILVILWHETSALGLEGGRVQKLLKALFNNIPPYSAITYMNTIGLHLYRIYTEVPMPPYKAWKKNLTLVQPIKTHRCYFCKKINFVWSSCLRTLVYHSINIKELKCIFIFDMICLYPIQKHGCHEYDHTNVIFFSCHSFLYLHFILPVYMLYIYIYISYLSCLSPCN